MTTALRSWTNTAGALTMVWALATCKDDPSPSTSMDTGTGADSDTSAGPGDTDPPATGDTGPIPEGTTDPSADSSDSADSLGSDTDEPPPGNQLYAEQFEGPDGSPWPDPWEQAGNQVTVAELDGGRARLSGNPGNVGRMVLPGFSETDVDVVFTVTYDDFLAQGVGFYARQNGGALQQTPTFGQGYAVYVEGGFVRHIGVWRETDGVEEELAGEVVPGGMLTSGTPYRVHFQCFTEGGQTRLRARIWPAGQAEPGAWQVDTLDSTPVLQGTAGSFAADIYNYAGTGSVYIDDVVISQLTPG